jgi:4-hydroxybenzoyl-CoA reductase subunit beta
MAAMQAFVLESPRTIAEAAALLDREPGARLLAGGTDLVPNLRRGIEQPAMLVHLGAVQDLAAISWRDGLGLGAGVTLAHIADDPAIARHYPALAQAAASVAAPGHRASATLGGNLCLDTRCVFYNQSAWWRASNAWCLKRGGDTCHVAPQGERCHAAFCGDVAAALLALDASVEIASVRGVRTLPLVELYRDDGAAPLDLARDELLTRVHVPAQPEGARSGYRKARVRGAIDFPLAGVACGLSMHDARIATLRIGITGTQSYPLLLEGTHELAGRSVDDDLLAAIAKLVQKQVSPMRTTVTPSNYRRQVAVALARRLVRELAA